MLVALVNLMILELPPRTRRILAKVMNWLDEKGTTSAYAENTSGSPPRLPRNENYLRVRGEYKLREDPRVMRLELPPRTRRILDYLNSK